MRVKGSVLAKYEEDLALSFLSFLITVVTFRGLSFFTPRYSAFSYQIIRLKHPLFLLCLALSLLLSYILNRRYLLFLSLGVVLGIIGDCAGMLYRSGNSAYWSIANLSAILSLNCLFLLLLWLGSKGEIPKIEPPRSPRPNPENPLVSVVIPVYNEENYVGTVLHSLLEQEFQDFEVIVVDNASEDATPEIARKFGARVIFEHKKAIGAARQRGALEAKGEIIAMTDADTILPKNWLSRIVEEFSKDEKLVAFGGLYTFYSGPLIARLISRYLAPIGWKLDKVLSGGSWNIPGCNLAFRKSAFMKVGGFKTNFCIGEDADLTLRLKEIGKVVLDPNFRVQTSGRRYISGFLRGTLPYAKNTLGRLFLKKHIQTPLPPVRKEPSPPKTLPLLPFITAIFYLVFLFWQRNPVLLQEKVRMEQKLKVVKLVLAKEIHSMKHLHLNR